MSEHRSFVPPTANLKEFTFRAVFIGLLMTVILGAANAYLGLRAGQTIAATYPAAVIGMAILRVFKGSILEENIARTAGSIGESVAAGAVFTLPAFVLSGAWTSFAPADAYWKSTALMLVGGVLGVLFVSMVRRVMVEDPELPFPESVAASEIHKAGQRGADAAKYLFYNIGVGAMIYLAGAFQVFAADKDYLVRIGQMGKSLVKLGSGAAAKTVGTGGFSMVSAPTVSPAYLGVGYIIGLRLSAITFSGGVLAWGFLAPLVIYFLGPHLNLPPGSTDDSWFGTATAVWRFIVRPIAVGGMLVGAAYTMFRMRKNLAGGLRKGFEEMRKGVEMEKLSRTERYMTFKTVFGLIAIVFALMIALYIYLSGNVVAGVTAAVVMLIVGFFFATVSGYLVGVIGSTNNPISGITLSTLIIAALLMVALGVSGIGGVAVVLGVAAVVCVSSAVAGELLQDFKVGYILGGTPRTIQIVELIAVICASLVMYFPLFILHEGNIKAGGIGFGDKQLSAPQAGLMAALAQGIVGGDMPWPLVVVGVFMGIAMILLEVRSPMLVAVGMYLPFNTTSAIFVGGLIRWLSDRLSATRGNNAAQNMRIESVGVLVASGLIAGESLAGLVIATFQFKEWPIPQLFKDPSYFAGACVMLALAALMIALPLSKAGRPEDPAPPAVMM